MKEEGVANDPLFWWRYSSSKPVVPADEGHQAMWRCQLGPSPTFAALDQLRRFQSEAVMTIRAADPA
jgi:hypothetical protein